MSFLQISYENVPAVQAALGTYYSAVKDAVRSEVQSSTRLLVERIKTQKLSGQVLKVRTDTLRQSISDRLEESGDLFSGVAYTSVPYAGVHEYGFSGTVSVREHTRLQTQAFGRPITPRQVIVSAHDMRMNLPERSFMRSALADHQSDFADAMLRATQTAAAQVFP